MLYTPNEYNQNYWRTTTTTRNTHIHGHTRAHTHTSAISTDRAMMAPDRSRFIGGLVDVCQLKKGKTQDTTANQVGSFISRATSAHLSHQVGTMKFAILAGRKPLPDADRVEGHTIGIPAVLQVRTGGQHGLGVFALRAFTPGQHLTAVRSVLLSANHKQPKNEQAYTWAPKGSQFVHCQYHLKKSNITRFVNSCHKTHHTPNVTLTVCAATKLLILTAIDHILPGDELLHSYHW